MDILAGSIGTVKFTVPSGLTAATFAAYKDNAQVGATGNATISGTVATCVLPYAATAEAGEVEVRITFSFQSANYTHSQRVRVATPILPTYQIKEILGPNATDEEVMKIEVAVRRIIEVFCEQKFEKFVGTKTVWGVGDPFLKLPRRLESFNTINGFPANVDLRNYGWLLMAKGLKPIEWRPSGMTVPITNPYSRGVFRNNTSYAIDGVWGWSDVPTPVQEAAKLLINDYACADSAYRDRFIESMTAADWRLQFNPGAYINTGNVRANQLLEPYKVSRLAII